MEDAGVGVGLARGGGGAVGRGRARVDRLGPEVGGLKPGFCGMLAAEDKAETMAALFGAAETWLAARDAVVVRGPFDLSINQPLQTSVIDVTITKRRHQRGHRSTNGA